MKLIADLHTHTLFSTHAYSSPEEMIRRAGEMGLYAIALTDHGYTCLLYTSDAADEL